MCSDTCMCALSNIATTMLTKVNVDPSCNGQPNTAFSMIVFPLSKNGRVLSLLMIYCIVIVDAFSIILLIGKNKATANIQLHLMHNNVI